MTDNYLQVFWTTRNIHRWAAIVAYNAAHPKQQIPMQVRVIDEPIVPLVHRSNKFAEAIGIKAKAADTGAKG